MSEFILIRIINQEDPGPLVAALRAELDAYLQTTRLRPSIDYTIEGANETDPLRSLVERTSEDASSKQVWFLESLIKRLRYHYNQIISDEKVDEQARLILHVYETECKDGKLITSRASSMIEVTKDILEEIDCLESTSAAP